MLRTLAALLTPLLLAACGAGSDEATVGAGAPPSAFPPPDRPVASIVSPDFRPEAQRDRDGEFQRVADLLGVGPGSRVADIGAGGGYYTVRLAPRVGAGGRVFAVDVMPRYVDRLRERVQALGLANVTVVQGRAWDPALPPNSVDLALMIHMYHEVERPYALLHNLAPALQGSRRVAVVDLDRPTSAHGTPIPLLLCEFTTAGYVPDTLHRMGGEYLYVFRAPPDSLRPTPEEISARVRARPCRQERP